MFCPRHVFAYLDPGTGSMVFQTIVAALAGVAYAVRLYWGKLRSFFGRTDPAGAALTERPDSRAPDQSGVIDEHEDTRTRRGDCDPLL